jgi:hypothetical protein
MKTNHHNTRKARIIGVDENTSVILWWQKQIERKSIEDDHKQLQLLKDLHKKHATKKRKKKK